MKIIEEIRSKKKYIFFAALISLLLMLPEIVLSYDFKHFLVMIFTLALLLLLAVGSKVLFVVAGIYLSVINVVIMHVALHWGYAYADLGPRFSVALQSPKSETVGYLTTFLDYRDVISVSYVLVTLYLVYKFLRSYPGGLKIFKIISLLLVFGMTVLAFPYLKQREPFNIIPKLVSVSQGNSYVSQRKLFLKSLISSTKKSNKMLYEKIIFILGESASRHHMPLYGYKAQTTPFLSQLNESKKLYVFDAIAPSNQTRYSVPIYMTQANVEDFYEAFTHSSSLMLDFNLGGYATIWLSAQGKVGHHNDYIAACADDANRSVFINNFYNTWAKKDIELVHYLKKNTLSNDKRMYLIHLTGSHVKYTNRYEENITLFKNPKNIVEEYDNTIYYTDYVIKELFKKLVHDDEKALVVYVSDHAEVVSPSKNGHGFSFPYKDEYDVPFVIYSSIHNERLEQLKEQNKKHYFNLENMYSMVKYISGVSDELNLSRESKVIAVDPKYIFDYDKLHYYDPKE